MISIQRAIQSPIYLCEYSVYHIQHFHFFDYTFVASSAYKLPPFVLHIPLTPAYSEGHLCIVTARGHISSAEKATFLANALAANQFGVRV